MRIAIDIDQTILDSGSLVYRLTNILFAGKIRKKLNYTNIENEVKKNIIHLKMLDAKNYYELDNAVEIIRNWFNQGDEIILLSCRPNFASFNNGLIDWLNRSELPYSRFCVKCTNKTLFCINENVDLLIDNTYKICKNASKNNVNSIFYNPKGKTTDIPQAKTWDEIDDFVQHFKDCLKVLN